MRMRGGLTQVEYSRAHYLVYRQFGKPKHCTQCGMTDPTKRYEWANQTGNYFDPSDYKRLCSACHGRFDATRRALSGKPTRQNARPRQNDHPQADSTRSASARISSQQARRASPAQIAIQHEYDRPWRDVLTHMLYVRRLTQRQAAAELRVPRGTIAQWVVVLNREHADRMAAVSQRQEAFAS